MERSLVFESDSTKGSFLNSVTRYTGGGGGGGTLRALREAKHPEKLKIMRYDGEGERVDCDRKSVCNSVTNFMNGPIRKQRCRTRCMELQNTSYLDLQWDLRRPSMENLYIVTLMVMQY